MQRCEKCKMRARNDENTIRRRSEKRESRLRKTGSPIKSGMTDGKL